jgi:hypothetical protein
MISDEQLEAWVKLYDLGWRNFDDRSAEAFQARSQLSSQIRDAYQSLAPKGVSFTDFKGAALKRIIERLKTQPPTV